MMPQFPAEIGGKIPHKILPTLSAENKSHDRSFSTRQKRSREWGASKSSFGPLGTMPVGLT